MPHIINLELAKFIVGCLMVHGADVLQSVHVLLQAETLDVSL